MYEFINHIGIGWERVPGATHYQIFRSQSIDGPKVDLKYGWWFSRPYTADGSAEHVREPGAIYCYWVRAAASAKGAGATGFSGFDTGWIETPRTVAGIRAMVRGLVRYLYSAALSRDASASVLTIWENSYYDVIIRLNVDARFVARELGHLFLESEEYASFGRDDAEFIRDCYQTFLMRSPGPGDVESWTSDVDGQGNPNWSRAQAMSTFSESEEAGQLADSMFPDLNGDPTRNFVTVMYDGVFDRLADAEGLAYWARVMDSARDKRAAARYLALAFLLSDEGRTNAPTNRDRVVRLYRAFLGRFPAENEIDYWLEKLDSGAETLESLVGLFADSAEFSGLLDRYF